MHPKHDSQITNEFLEVFQLAWRAALVDYDARRINGEHTLQASLYHHLLRILPQSGGYRVFTEAAVRVEVGDVPGVYKSRKIDLLVVHGIGETDVAEVIAAIELKFTPRGSPLEGDIKKDLESLELISNRRAKLGRSELYMERFLAEKGSEREEFKISAKRKLIFACVYNEEEGDKAFFSESKFWSKYGPNPWRGEMRAGTPHNVGVAFGRAKANELTKDIFFGPPFNRLNQNGEST